MTTLDAESASLDGTASAGRRTLSGRLRQLPDAGARQLYAKSSAFDPDVISLGLGEPDFKVPEEALDEVIDALRRGKTGYSPPDGSTTLRREIALLLSRLYGIEYHPVREILITAGVSEALSLALAALLDPGDEVIVPQPCFLSFVAAVTLAGGKPVTIATRAEDGFQVSLEQLERAVTPRTRALMINYPNNPTGAVLEHETHRGIAEFARRHDLLVISDEIYDRFIYDVEPVCVPSLEDLLDRTILLGGFSKTFGMTGWRLGFAAAPHRFVEAMAQIHQFTLMCAPTPAQIAVEVALQLGDAAIEVNRRKYDRRRRLIFEGLHALGLPCSEPRGAFYAFPSIAATGLDDIEFAERLLREEKVAVVPGRYFGDAGKGYVRCSYATSSELINRALSRISRFLSIREGNLGDE